MRTIASKLLLGLCCLTTGSLYAQETVLRTMVVETKDGKEPMVVRFLNISKVTFPDGKMHISLSNEKTKELFFLAKDLTKIFFSFTHDPNRTEGTPFAAEGFSISLSTDKLAVICPETERTYDLKLYATAGKLLKHLTNYQSGESITIAELPSAVYLIIIDNRLLKFSKP